MKKKKYDKQCAIIFWNKNNFALFLFLLCFTLLLQSTYMSDFHIRSPAYWQRVFLRVLRA